MTRALISHTNTKDRTWQSATTPFYHHHPRSWKLVEVGHSKCVTTVSESVFQFCTWQTTSGQVVKLPLMHLLTPTSHSWVSFSPVFFSGKEIFSLFKIILTPPLQCDSFHWKAWTLLHNLNLAKLSISKFRNVSLCGDNISFTGEWRTH